MMRAGRDYVAKRDIVQRQQPLGHVIAPTQAGIGRAAQIICGHDVVQALDEERRANFEIFVREVLRTESK